MEDIDKFRIIDKLADEVRQGIKTNALNFYCSKIEDLELFRQTNLEQVKNDIDKIFVKKIRNSLDVSDLSDIIQIYILNKIQELVNEFDMLCIKKFYNYKVEVDRNSLELNDDIKDDIVKFLESYTSDSFLINENIRDFKYSSLYQTTQILINKILKKYENKCYIVSKNYYNDLTFGISLATLNKETSFENEKFIIKDIPLIKENLEEDELRFLLSQFKYCIDKNVKVIAIPIMIPEHANALIYKFETNTFEYFEPHGIAVNMKYDVKNSVDLLISKIIDYLVKNNIIPENPKYKDSEQTCPILSNKQKTGFQLFEDKDILKKFPQNIDIESIKLGYCQMWALFYLELALKYPNIDTTLLNQTVFDYLKNRDEDDKGFLIFITGYIYKYFSELKKEFKNIENDSDVNKLIESIESSNIEIKSIKSLKKIENLGLTCLNLEFNKRDEILEYLRKDIKNNIIISVEFKDNLRIKGRKYGRQKYFCYKRDKLINSMKIVNVDNEEYYKIFDEYEDENIYIDKDGLDFFSNLDILFFNIKYYQIISYDKDLYEIIGYDLNDYKNL